MVNVGQCKMAAVSVTRRVTAIRSRVGRIGAALLMSTLGLLSCFTVATAGSTTAFRYPCPSLGKEQIAQVYLPSGDAPEDGWPVLYLLHGLNGTAADWTNLGNVASTLDRLIATRRIKPLVVVMPEGGSSWYVDSSEVGGPGNYATAIGHDLPDAVENAFPVGTDRLHRAIAGVSMGGYGALRLALKAPERFAAVAALSPAIWQNVPTVLADAGHSAGDDTSPPPSYFHKIDPDTVTIGVDTPPEGRHFGTAFGTPFDADRFNAANVFTLLERDVEAKKRLPPIFLSVGDDDSHRLWRGSIAFFETMQMNNRDMEFRVTDGDHNWSLWRSTIADALLYIDGRIGRAVVR